MDQRTLLGQMLSDRNCAKKALARKIGVAPSGVAQLFKHNNMTIGMLLRVCEALDFEIVVRRKNYVRQMDGEYIYDGH